MLLAGRLELDVRGMGAVILAQATWSVGVAGWLVSLRSGRAFLTRPIPYAIALAVVAIGGAALVSLHRTDAHGGAREVHTAHAEHAAAPSSSSSGGDVQAPVAELAFEDIGGRIYVPAEIGGHAVSAVLDTGAGSTLMNLALADEWQLPAHGTVDAHGSGGASIQGKILGDTEISLGGLRHAIPYAIPFDALAPAEGRRLEVLLGYDFFREYIVEIDYAKRRVRVFAGDAGLEARGIVLPVHFVSSLPHVSAEMAIGSARYELEALVDTGASSTSLTLRFRADPPLEVAQTERFVTGHGVGGAIEGRYFRPDALQLGSAALARPVVTLIESIGGQERGRAEYDLGIGADLLRRFRITLDYPHERILLEPGDELTRPFEADKTGLRLEAQGKDLRRFEVVAVMPGSSAMEAGVEVGDVLEAVDGVAASGFTLQELRELFRSATAEQWEFVLRRGSQSIRLMVSARSII